MIDFIHVAIDDSSDKRHTGIISFDRAAGGKLLIPSGSVFPSSPTEGELFWNIASGNLYRRNETNTDWETISGAGAPEDVQYLVLATNATLTNERVFTPGTGIVATDGGAGSSYTLNINNNVVATVSGTTFTGPVTASAGVNLLSQSIQSVKTVEFDREYNIGTVTGSIQINWRNGQKQVMTLSSSNITASFISGSNPPGVSNYLLRIVQGAAGGPYTMQWPSGSIAKWPGGTTPTLSSGANKVDIVTFYFNGSTYFGQASLNFA